MKTMYEVSSRNRQFKHKQFRYFPTLMEALEEVEHLRETKAQKIRIRILQQLNLF